MFIFLHSMEFKYIGFVDLVESHEEFDWGAPPAATAK